MTAPAARLAPQPWMTAPPTRAVLDALGAGGVDVRFVGGCVRDAWLGRPVKDIDLATHAPPDRVMAVLAAAGLTVVPTGIAHGTVTAVVDRQHYEITTLRRDVETFGRHARVEFTDDWKEDAGRRDLTMNALSCTPEGEVYDPFDGLADLAAGRVRFVGAARLRIREDVLRLLRFFRFYAHYGRGAPDAEALAAAQELAPLLPTLSGERVQGELIRLLTAPDPGAVWRLMRGRGIIHHLLPWATGAERLDRVSAVERGLGLPADGWRRLAATLPVDLAVAQAVGERLKMSKADRRRLEGMVEPAVAVAVRHRPAERRRTLYRLGDERLYRDLVLLDAAAAPGPLSAEAVAAALEAGADLASLVFPLAGKDVLGLGVARGPAVSRLLRQLEHWWIARDFRPAREACLAEARRRLAASARLGE